jgi:hypothetical protein
MPVLDENRWRDNDDDAVMRGDQADQDVHVELKRRRRDL